MANILSPFSERTYALLRIFAGALFTFHGVQKIFGILTDHQLPVGSQVWVGGIRNVGPNEDSRLDRRMYVV